MSSPLQVSITSWYVHRDSIFASSYVNYCIETTEGDRTFNVFRRFKDFQVLADRFGSSDLPSRGWLKMSKFDSEAFVEERRIGLEAFLRKLLCSGASANPSTRLP